MNDVRLLLRGSSFLSTYIEMGSTKGVAPCSGVGMNLYYIPRRLTKYSSSIRDVKSVLLACQKPKDGHLAAVDVVEGE